jgi:hypothetical protein
VPGSRSRGRPATAWFDNTLEWTQLSGTDVIQTTRQREHWRALTPHNYTSNLLLLIIIIIIYGFNVLFII